MGLAIKRASKKKKKVKGLFYGLSGAGKTRTAIELGIALARGNKVIVIDTEGGNSELYASLYDFDVAVLEPPFSLDSLIKDFQEAESYVGEGGVVIIDSLSKYWEGVGGALDEVNHYTKGNKGKTMEAWGVVTPKVARAKEIIFSSKTAHVLVTARCKSETIMEEYVDYSGKTKTKAVKVGLAATFKEGIEYEADFALEFSLQTNRDGTDTQLIRNTKPPRCEYFKEFQRSIDGRIGEKWDTNEVANQLLFWLDQGEDPAIAKLKDSLISFMDKYSLLSGNEHPRRKDVDLLSDENEIRQLGKDVVAQVKELQATTNSVAAKEEIPY